jgi:uncharacterized protein (TIGR02466 family)
MNFKGTGPMVGKDEWNVEYPFGPGIYNSTITEEFYNRLVAHYEERRANSSTWQQENLAGNFKHGTSKELDPVLFEKDIVDHLGNYLEASSQYGRLPGRFVNSGKEVTLKNFKLDSLWVNFQRAGDFNPYHIHSGDISFVIYTKIPPELSNEHVISNTKASGRIYFAYGEESEFNNAMINYAPEEKHIFIFPARLRHFVWPFFSDVERISVSGNINFIEPL